MYIYLLVNFNLHKFYQKYNIFVALFYAFISIVSLSAEMLIE